MAKRAQRRSKATAAFFGLIAEAPPTAQILSRKAMKSEWPDPSDLTPNASRTARAVSGWRGFCPLRWNVKRHGERSSFNQDHIEAADRLRACFDAGSLGFNTYIVDGRPVNALVYRPSQGPTRSALRQLRCKEAFTEAWKLFSDDAKAILILVVLKNTSLGKAVEVFEGRISKPRLTQTLVEALDRLVDHWNIGEPRQRQRAA
jgi:hypothetical protein